MKKMIAKNEKEVKMPSKGNKKTVEPLSEDDIAEIEKMVAVVEAPLDRTIRDLKGSYDQEEIDPHPDFQRNPGIWNDEQASRLIESLILKIPIPRVYTAEILPTEQKKYVDEVVDGQQRLTTVFNFIDGVFRLKGLTHAPKLNGLSFDILPAIYRERILKTPFNIIRISSTSYPETKLLMFENLNRGSVALNKQEVRAVTFHGPIINFVRELTDNTVTFNEFMKASGLKNDREIPEELVAEALAFHVLRPDAYKTKEQFINLFYSTYKNYPADCSEFQEWHDAFTEACLTIMRAFGTRPFVHLNVDKSKRAKHFAESVFTAYMYGFMDIKDHQLARKHADDIYRATCNLYKNDDYVQSVTGSTPIRHGSTQDPVLVKRRLEMFKDSLRKECKIITPRLSEDEIATLHQKDDDKREEKHKRELEEAEASRDN